MSKRIISCLAVIQKVLQGWLRTQCHSLRMEVKFRIDSIRSTSFLFHQSLLHFSLKMLQWCQWCVMIHPYSFLSWTHLFFSVITHPLHIIGPLTPLVFIITSFHLLLWTSLTHSWLLICTSLWFHHIPPSSICFVIILDLFKSHVYKPLTCYMSP